MDFFTSVALATRKSADALVIPFWKATKHPEVAADIQAFDKVIYKLLEDPLASNDFKGEEGEVLIHYIPQAKEKRLILLGLGSSVESSTETLRRSYAKVTASCRSKKLKTLNILLPKALSMRELDVVRGVAEGLLLPNYAFTSLKSEKFKNEKVVLLEHVAIIGASKPELKLGNKTALICDSVNFARDLVNGNADDVTPKYLGKIAMGLEKTCKHVKTTVFDKKRIEKEKMHLLLAVNRASSLDPYFIIVEYKGNPKSKDHTVIVGKGITYDTGGLILKPRGSMETMKDDMSGAAAVLGVIHAVSAIGLPVNVTAIIPATENCIGSKSYKPGDVYSSYLGKTVEVVDTDAEGRLVLADALAYAVKNLKPSRIIDIATLTGSIIMALGEEATGLMSNNDAIAGLLAAAGSETGERVWRMPLYEEYKAQLKSDIADIKNVGGRSAGSITAAIFLKEFVGDCPWAHLDIAGTAFLTEAKRYIPKYGTGVGVRLLVSFLESF